VGGESWCNVAGRRYYPGGFRPHGAFPMDIYQLKTFVAVAREGSITRASEVLHLSQPAVSAHIKSMEDTLGLGLFERTARGMSLTADGKRLLGKAEATLAAHRELMDEATRNKHELTGRLRLGAYANSNNELVGRLLTVLSERRPGVEVALKHGTSQEILAGIRNGSLDGGFYNDPDDPEPDLTAIRVSEFKTFLVAAPGIVPPSAEPDWKRLAELAWIYPAQSACCSRTAEDLFKAYRFKPKRIVSVDRQEVSRALIAGGVGVGLLHAGPAKESERRGEVELLFEADRVVGTYFAHLASRNRDPLLEAATSILRES
jgi:DNA-binding transcriptional LysR family regulator